MDYLFSATGVTQAMKLKKDIREPSVTKTRDRIYTNLFSL